MDIFNILIFCWILLSIIIFYYLFHPDENSCSLRQACKNWLGTDPSEQNRLDNNGIPFISDPADFSGHVSKTNIFPGNNVIFHSVGFSLLLQELDLPLFNPR